MTIVSTLDSGILTVEIARPEKKNAFTADMYRRFAELLRSASADSSVNTVLILGQPTIFSAGNDLEDFRALPPADDEAPVFQFMRALIACDKPVVAGVRGAAIGVGTTLLLHCDLVFVADDTQLSMPFVNLGLVPEFGSSWILPRLLGTVRAAEHLLLGTPMSAAAAVEWGIANAALPADEVVRHARSIAARISALPPESVRATKALLRRWTLADTEHAIAEEAKIFRERLASPECGAAIQAFFTKRPAKPR